MCSDRDEWLSTLVRPATSEKHLQISDAQRIALLDSQVASLKRQLAAARQELADWREHNPDLKYHPKSRVFTVGDPILNAMHDDGIE